MIHNAGALSCLSLPELLSVAGPWGERAGVEEMKILLIEVRAGVEERC